MEKITARVKKDQWRYVNTSCNPADILSQGIQPKDLLQMKTWWKDPPLLQLSLQDWPRRPHINFDRELPDLRKTVLLVPPPEEEFGIKFSSYVRLLRVFACIRRFCEKTRKLNKVPFPDYLTVLELYSARNALFVVSQKFTYCHERLILMKNKQLSTSHPMGSLSPYLDSRGIMRVGGRLQKAGLGYDATHPILLSIKSHIVKLLIEHTHCSCMHAGPSTIMALIADTYYIPKIKSFLRTLSRSYLVCKKVFAKTSQQLMGELPTSRVRPARPFSIVGLDFAGPFTLKLGHTRRPVWICVFVCFTTRACHIELVADLTTAAFVACFRRFVSRRGLPHQVHSDNGANFVGANKCLSQLYTFMRSKASRNVLPIGQHLKISVGVLLPVMLLILVDCGKRPLRA